VIDRFIENICKKDAQIVFCVAFRGCEMENAFDSVYIRDRCGEEAEDDAGDVYNAYIFKID
jgi:hypothetical protein